MFSPLNFLIGTVVGIILGLIAGLFPGIHPNNFYPYLKELNFNAYLLSSLAISLLISFSFTSILATTLFGSPDFSPESLPPVYKLIAEGKTRKVIYLSLFGGLVGLILSLLFILHYFLLQPIYDKLAKSPFIVIPVILMLITFALQKFPKSLVIVLLSGWLGIITTLNYKITDSLTIAFSAMFGLPFLLKAKPLENVKAENHYEDFSINLLPALAGALAAFVASLFPTLSVAVLIFFFLSLFRISSAENFIYAFGSLTTADAILSLFSFYFLERARNGSIVFVKDLLIKLSPFELLAFVSVSILSAILSFVAVELVAKTIIKPEYSRNFKKLALLFYFLFIGFLIVKSWENFLLFIAAFSIGLLTAELEVNYSVLVSFLAIPYVLMKLGII